MRRFLELIEQKENVVFTFGRFNPPTTGHEKLIQKVASVAGNSPFRIYPSYSQNQKKDPLPFTLKIAYMRKMYPKYARNIIADKDARTAINIATKLYDEGFKNVTMVVGSDRVREFSSLLNNYNGVEGKRHGFYKFDNINVVSAGERDPDAEGVTGMSASKMRQAASDSDFDSFSQGLPRGFKDGKKLYLDVRKHMGIREERDMGEMTDFESLRDMYLTGKIWNIGDLVEANGVEGRVIRKGTNYLAYNDSQGKVHKVWLHEINLNEIQKGLRRVKQDPDIKGDKGTEPAKYYKGVKKSVKPKRDDHFERGAKMDDDNPAAYTPAPGDKDKSGKLKKTKPSKHTLKFKKMFGDDVNEMMPALARLATIKPSTYAGAAAAVGQAVSKMKPKKTSSKSRKLSREENEIDERSLSKSQQNKLDDLEAYLGHLQRVTATPSRRAEIEATKKKIKKLKSEFNPDDLDESWSIDEMTGINVPELIRTTVHRLTHPKGYEKIIQKYIQDVGMEKQRSGSKDTNAAILSNVANMFGFDRVKPLQMYVNKLVKKGRLPQELAAEYEVNDMEEDFQLDEKIAGLVKKSEKSKVPYGILKKVYNRGMAAWRTGHRPGTTPQQWAFARVNSFLTGGGARKADADLWSKASAAKKAKKEELEFDESKTFRLSQSDKDIMKQINKIRDKAFKFSTGSKEHTALMRQMDMQKSKLSKDAQRSLMMGETIEDELGEKYNLYHSTFSGAMQHAYDYAKKKLGVTVDKREIDSKVATGPKKPSEGKTNKYRLKGKGGNLQIQVFNKGGSKPFELNMYKEEFTEESVQTWYESVDTRMKYQLNHGDDWWWKMNEVHDKMLEKLGLDEGCSIDGDETPKVRMTMKEFALRNAWGEIDEAAEYDGRPVKLNNPTRGDVKKYKVYVRNDKGNVVKVEFGDPNMEIKRDDPARRKSFRARHNCDNPGPKYKARFWSCKFWEKGKSVTDLMKG